MVSRRLHNILLLLISPFVVLILVLASGVNAPLLLFLYVAIVVEGVGLAMWILSKIMAEDVAPTFYQQVSSKSYFPDMNRAERLLMQVKSASRGSGDYRRYSRSEISSVLKDIINRDSEPSPELEFLLNPEKAEKARARFDYLSSLDHVITQLESG